MAVQWTENQLNAIEAVNGSLLISAAAGSGKTAVLVERVIRRIVDDKNPIDANKLLVVTYTRAAAKEMKERIQNKLEQLINEDPLNSHLRRQQLLLNSANISTIHSFCKDLIKENFYNLDVSVDYRLADETEIKILKAEALESVIEELYTDDSENFVNFVNLFSNAKSDTLLKDVILKLYTFLISHPFSESWLNDKEKMYDLDVNIKDSLWGIVILDYVRDAVDFCLHIAKYNHDIITQNMYLGDKLYDLINSDYEFINLLSTKLIGESFDEVGEYVKTFNAGRMSVSKEYKEDENKVKIQSKRDLLKKTVGKIQDIFAFTQDNFKEDNFRISPVVHYLFKAVKMFDNKFKELKKEKNVADFSDLEHWTLKLLVNETENGYEFTKSAETVSSRFVEVMVDEYQDANEIQDLIFRAVSNNAQNLFVVGDVKQSIYGFRQAMPEIFIRRKNSSSLYDKNLDNYPSKVILDKNFRSRNGVTGAVNFVFERIMSTKIGDIEYDEEEKLVCGATYDESSTADMNYHIISKGDSEENDNIIEARYIASIIKEKIKEKYQVNDKGTLRDVKYSDFCILLRSASSTANNYVQELSNLNIPSSSETTPSFLSAYEIMVMMNLLRIIDNPIQDIPLLSVMLSPLGGFTEDLIAQIRLLSPKSSLFVALQSSSKTTNKSLEFLDLLTKLRTLSVTTETSTLINIIYNETAFTSFVEVLSDGNTKLNNLRLLLEYAKSFEKAGYRGISSFVRYIDKIEEQQSDLQSRGKTSDDSDTVKIMTIHHSKGLEFPFCFIANSNRKIKSDKSDEVLLHNTLGVGLRKKDFELNCRYNTLPRMAISLEIEKESISEEIRVLYVAMTRAREKLYVISTHKDGKKYVLDMSAKIISYDKIHPYIVRSVTSLEEWITLCALLHKNGDKIRVDCNMTILDFYADYTEWNIKIIDGVEQKTDEEERESEDEKTNEYKNNEIIEQEKLNKIIARFSTEYKNQALTTIPVKVSASELAHKDFYKKFSFQSKPDFASKKKLTGAKKGTAIHTFMQFVDFDKYIKDEKSEIERLVKYGFITEEQSLVLDKEKIEKCLSSEVMKRLLKSSKTYREYRFTAKIKAGLVNTELTQPFFDEEIILQGAIDTAFVENDKLIILDYKTDKVKEIEELKVMYKKQLDLYKSAMEQCTGLEVLECIIYSFEHDKFIIV